MKNVFFNVRPKTAQYQEFHNYGRMVEQSDMSVLDQRGREESALSSRKGIASFIFSFSKCLDFGKNSFEQAPKGCISRVEYTNKIKEILLLNLKVTLKIILLIWG